MPTKTGEAGTAARLVALAAEARPHLDGTDSAEWLDRLEREHDGLRKAFSWFLSQGRSAEALQLAGDLWVFQEIRGYAEESRAWLAKALAAPGAEAGTVARARALYGAGILAFRKLDEDEARRDFMECLGIARGLGNAFLVVKATTGLARIALRRNDTREVRRLAEDALAVARERGEKADAATPLHMLAAAARVDGDFRRSRAFYRENLALNRELGRTHWVSVELGNLGALEVLDGNIAEAIPLLRESLEMAHDGGDKYLAPYELIWLGRVALAKGDPARAARLLAAAKAQFDATGLAMDPDEGPEYEKGLAAIRGAMDEKAFSAAWEKGKAMGLDEAVAFALNRE